MKQQFAAKHRGPFWLRGQPFRCLPAYRRRGESFSSRLWRNTAFRSRGRAMPLRCSSPPLGWGVCWAVFCRIKGPRCVVGHGPALRRLFCSGLSAGLGRVGGSFWYSASRRGWARPFLPLYPVLRPKSGTRAARGWRPGSSAVQGDFPARS